MTIVLNDSATAGGTRVVQSGAPLHLRAFEPRRRDTYAIKCASAFPEGSGDQSAIAGSSGVVVEAVLRGTNTGPLQDPVDEMPATDKSVEMPFVIVWEIRDGRVTRDCGYYDSATLMRQLGLMPEVPTGSASAA